MPSAPPSIVDQRRDQIIPKLDSLQIGRVRRFGEVRSFAAGERIMPAGEVALGLVVVLAGKIAVAEQTDLDVPQLVMRSEQGDFLGELAQPAGRLSPPPAVVDGVNILVNAVADQTADHEAESALRDDRPRWGLLDWSDKRGRRSS